VLARCSDFKLLAFFFIVNLRAVMVVVTQSVKATASTAVEAMDATNIVKLILMPFTLDPVKVGV
jgi:hypothetical protein